MKDNRGDSERITAFNINARYDDFNSGNPFVVEIKKTGIEVAA